MKEFFITSDHHFGHENIIKYCDRPFNSVDHMDWYMIEKWNSVVSKDDVVFHLGDFCLGSSEMAKRYFKKLNGKISILWNLDHHDKRWLNKDIVYNSKYHAVNMLPAIFSYKIEDSFLVLCHYPLERWNRSHYGSIHFHGHIHRKNSTLSIVDRRINAGVDLNNFTPINLRPYLDKWKNTNYLEGIE